MCEKGGRASIATLHLHQVIVGGKACNTNNTIGIRDWFKLPVQILHVSVGSNSYSSRFELKLGGFFNFCCGT